jgi:hypothetical protein
MANIFNINLGDTIYFCDLNDPAILLQGTISVISIRKSDNDTIYGVEPLDPDGFKVSTYVVKDQLIYSNLVHSWDLHPDFTTIYVNDVIGKSLYLWVDQKDITYVCSPATYVGGFTTPMLQGFTVCNPTPIGPINIIIDIEELQTDDAGLKYL